MEREVYAAGSVGGGSSGFSEGVLRTTQLKSLGWGRGNAVSVSNGVPRFLFSLIFRIPSFGLNMIFIVRDYLDVRDTAVKLSRQLRESQFCVL